MKALELLKSFHPSIGVYKFPSSCEVSEAMKELEEAMKPKTCEGCKYNTDNKPRCFKYNDCVREQTREMKQDRYEPKDNA